MRLRRPLFKLDDDWIPNLNSRNVRKINNRLIPKNKPTDYARQENMGILSRAKRYCSKIQESLYIRTRGRRFFRSNRYNHIWSNQDFIHNNFRNASMEFLRYYFPSFSFLRRNKTKIYSEHSDF